MCEAAEMKYNFKRAIIGQKGVNHWIRWGERLIMVLPDSLLG